MPPAASLGVDHEQAQVGAAGTGDGRDHAGRGVAANDRRLVGREQGAVELVDRGEVGHAPLAELRNRGQGRAVELGQLRHDPTLPGE